MALQEVLLDLAAAHLETVMPGYTHTQHAQPISLGFWASAHAGALARARAALARAGAAARSGAPGEIVALELREGLGALGEVTGRALGGDVLERIFSRFCVGK